jgi:protein-tyrosine phosphatase
VIDTHCHLLPGLDDGTRSLGEAVALATELRDAGVTTVLCTPHLSRRFPTDLTVARERLTALVSELAAAAIALELRLAAELSPAFAVSLDAAALAEATIGGRYVLVELEPATPASAVETIFEHLQARSLKPVFAHPERCRSIAQDPRTLVAARESGALVQIVATSVAGSWGRAVERAALGLLEAGRVDLLGSDSHRPGRAGRRLRDVLQLLTRRWGDDVVRQLTVDGPRAVLGA